MQRLVGLAIFSVIFFSAVHIHAAELQGRFNTEVKTTTVTQANKGSRNKNQLAIGSISDKSSTLRSRSASNSKVGTVIQSNKGALNQNDAAIRAITD